MKVLVIGCEGFIGKYVYNFFLDDECVECWGADVVTLYDRERYLLLDATNSDFNTIFENYAFDICINCSGAASVQDSFRNPLRDYTLNTTNVAKVLEAIRRYRPDCKFINLSSAAVYGNPSRLPIKESDSCFPLSPYGCNKLMAEQICAGYNSYFGIQTCSLRIFSAYGPGLKKQLLWDIYQKTIKDQNVYLLGTGNETRDFVYISDIVNAVWLIAEKGEFKSTVYNVASGSEISTKHVVEALTKALNYKGEISFSGSNRAGDPLNWCADISALKTLGYSPMVSFNEGVSMYADWCKNH